MKEVDTSQGYINKPKEREGYTIERFYCECGCKQGYWHYVKKVTTNFINERFIKDNKPSARMEEFLDKVDRLCFEYGYEFYPTVEGWTGRVNHNGEHETFACIGDGEAIQLLYLDGDGQGK
jgi:hypothetical protein